jgi:arsenate reductase-like glutaredoxin family protein
MTNLSKQVEVLSVTTDSFFTPGEEIRISKKLNATRIMKKELDIIEEIAVTGKIQKYKNKKVKVLLEGIIKQMVIKENLDELEAISKLMKKLKKNEDTLSKYLKKVIDKNVGANRVLNRDQIFYTKDTIETVRPSRVISFFESILTRALDLKTEKELCEIGKQVNDEVIVVKVFHYGILKDLIDKGFMYNNEFYKYLSSSSGQLKTKKCVFVKESALTRECENSEGEIYTVEQKLTCGLSRERINNTTFGEGENKTSGVNTNKYLAYLMLQNSAISKWEGFSIDEVLVIKDLELDLKGYVDYINRDTYEITPNVYKKDLRVNVTDGSGLCLPSVMDKSFQFRASWMKGLIIPCDFLTYAKEIAKNTIVTDVWGDKHCIEESGTKILITSSQLKMWKYYDNWEEFKTLFKKYECEAGICNVENVRHSNHVNYQFLQSLTKMEQSELEEIAKETNKDIESLGKSKEVMLRVLGATIENERKNPLQEALLIYDNLLNDPHVKSMIKNNKEKMVREARGGSLKVEGKRMFVYPDVYGWMEYLFKGESEPKGLLRSGGVYSNNLKVGEVNINRSPQLYIEHGIRNSVKSNDMKNWFIAGGLYVSNGDLLSRLLNFDWDGDELDIFTEKTYVKAGKEHMRGINPLFYEMESAQVQELNDENIYNSITLAFGASIGTVSNKLTRIYNSAGGFTEDKKTALAYLTMWNNFIIDYSKTLFKPELTPEQAMGEIKGFTKDKVPYFFQYSKGYKPKDIADKVVKQYKEIPQEDGTIKSVVEHEYTPVVNMLEDIISNTKIHFRNVANKLEYKTLHSVQNYEIKNKELYNVIVQKYIKINKNKNKYIDKDNVEYKDRDTKYNFVAKQIKEEFMTVAKEIDKSVTEVNVTDILVDYLYRVKNADNKNTLWECFGDILLANIKKNVINVKECERCETEFTPNHGSEKYCCGNCKNDAKRIKAAERQVRRRMKKKAM